MARLLVSRGLNQGQGHELTNGETRLGRNPDSHVVIDQVSVSRNHARILHEDGRFVIEDLRSRNGTYVNGQAIESKQPLAEGDEVEICDVVFRFYESDAPIAESPPQTDDEPSSLSGSGKLNVGAYIHDEPVRPDEGNSSSIVATLQAGDSSRSWRFSIKPEAKLRAIVSIMQSVGRVVDLQDVLQSILDGLFKIFSQAQQGFIMLKDPERDRMRLEATRVRSQKQAEVAVSMTVVRQTLRTGEAILSADAADDSRFNSSESLPNLEIRSMMCVPLLGQDDVRLGVLQIDTNNMAEQFSDADLDILLAVATPVALAIVNARHLAREMESKVLERELDFAREIQQSYLPSSMPYAAGYEFAHFYESAEQIGGDYFDCFGLKDGRICLAMGDVAGKGVPAALLMSRLYSSVRTQMVLSGDPVQTLTRINHEFSHDQSTLRFITLMLVVLDSETGNFSVVNAGHSPMLVCNRDGEVRQVGVRNGGMPIGVLPDQDFALTEDTLAKGSVAALYTDGITEARNNHGKLFGRERLSEQLGGTGTADELVSGVIEAVEKYRGAEPQADDTCLAIVRRLDA